jgi:hypothetical protein
MLSGDFGSKPEVMSVQATTIVLRSEISTSGINSVALILPRIGDHAALL